MSKTVDERVVEMRFDNKQFESNVRTSMSTIEKLKQALKFKGVSEGLDDISKSTKKVDFSGMSNGIESVNAKFSALQVMGVTALATITNAAVNAGTNIAKALTLDPIIGGFQEYETQMGAVQTILANTQSKGTTLNEVTAALDELNEYADQTIYNFTEMTKNIGTFTAAGVDLDKSVTAIKGIANLAAVSGSTSVQASTVMYQLSQALAAGRVSLMDWNSVVNGGMGGEVFQTALKRTAENMGTDVDALIEKYGSFRESLTQGGWLTAEVLTETLTQISGAYTEADLLAQGYTKEQAKQILELADTALSAATEIKTFTQLIDTVKESLGSGWAKTWQLIIGDFEEAKELWSGVGEVITGMVEASSEARNSVLAEGLGTGWDQLLNMNEGLGANEGYFKEVLQSVATEHGIAIDEMIEKEGSLEKTFKNGWVTTDILAESIHNMAEKTKGLSKEQLAQLGYTEEQAKALQILDTNVRLGLVDLDEYVQKMQMMSGRENIIEGLKNVFTELGKVMAPIGEAFDEVFPPMTGEKLYELTEKFKSLTEQFKIGDDVIADVKSTFKGLFSIVSLVGKVLGTILPPIATVVLALGRAFLNVTAWIGDFFTAINEGASTGDLLGGIGKALSTVADGISTAIESVIGKVDSLGDVFSGIGDIVSNFASTVGNGLKTAFSWISENVSIEHVLGGIVAAFTALGALNFGSLVGKLKDVLGGGIMGLIFGVGDGEDDDGGGPMDILKGYAEQFGDILDSLKGSIDAFTTGIKAGTLLMIAGAIGILAASLSAISKLNAEDIGKSLLAIGSLFVMLNLSFSSIAKSLSKFGSKGIVKAGVALIAMAAAIRILASALVELSQLNLREIGSALAAMGGALLEMIGALKLMEKVKVSLKSAVAMVVLAKACEILASAFKGFVGYSWDEIGRGLSSMGGALGELTAALAIMSKAGGFGSLLGSVGLLIAVQSLGTLAENLKTFGQLSWDEIERGLAGMGGALGELTACLAILSKVGGVGAVLGGASIFITVQSLAGLAEAFKSFSGYSWDEIGRGLAAMGGALGEVAVLAGGLGKLAGLSGILGGASIWITVQSLEQLAENFKKFAQIPWENIGSGLVAMGGALGEVALITGGLGSLAGIAGLFGAGTIWIAIQGLEQLATAFGTFAGYSWEEIGRGLAGMGGALLELAAISGATGYLTGIAGLVGAGTITLASQGLTELADAFGKFAEMDWDAIGRGLAAMGGALVETAIGSLLNTFSALGASSIATVAEPLGKLADSVQKWANVTVPEGLGTQLGELGQGIEKFNFAGWGADAIASMAEPLGTLADSVQKWANVTVPEGLGEQLKSLAPGIEAFNFSGWGGDAIATVAEPLGTLADSVNKWASVTVPENMESNLTSLANGVKAFDFSWGNSLDSFVDPLARMADSVNKWSTITIPDDMEGKLTGLANGVKAFNWSFGFSMDSFVDPLAKLADAVSKWNGVTVPDNIQSMLEGLANGCKAFDWSFGFSLDSFIGPLSDLGDVLPKYSGLAIATDIGTSIESLGNGLNSLKGKDPGELTGVASAIQTLGTAVQQISNYDFVGAASQLTSFADAINNINVSGNSFANLGNNIVNGFVNAISSSVPRVQAAVTQLANTAVTSFTVAIAGASTRSTAAGLSMVSGLSNGMRSGMGVLQSTINSILSSVLSSITGKASAFQSAGLSLASRVASGISNGKASAMAATVSLVSSASSALRGYYGSFYSSGTYVASGFAAGIRSGAGAAQIAAAAMASAASAAARANLKINSPSKVFYQIGEYTGEGFALGISSMQSEVVKSTESMGNVALEGTKSALSHVSELMSSDIDMTPTISPVLDLSNIENGVGAIDNMLGNSTPLSVLRDVGSISRSMNARNQNGPNDDVISAIDKLRGDIGNLSTNSYTVNGITYDDGTNIALAVQDLVRASRIERRI